MSKVITFHRSDLVDTQYTPEGIQRLSLVIRMTLLSLNISQRELAQRAGLSIGTINSYARGNVKEPSSEVIRALAPHVCRVVSWDEAKESFQVDAEETYEDNWRILDRIATDEWRKSLPSIGKSYKSVAESQAGYPSFCTT